MIHDHSISVVLMIPIVSFFLFFISGSTSPYLKMPLVNFRTFSSTYSVDVKIKTIEINCKSPSLGGVWFPLYSDFFFFLTWYPNSKLDTTVLTRQSEDRADLKHQISELSLGVIDDHVGV